MIESASSPDSQTDSQPASMPNLRGRRLRILGFVALLLLALIVVPPFINVNRFRRSILHSVSVGLGRPVYASAVELSLFPQPAFILHNLVVAEDPAFGAEPMMMAGTVTASLRASTLWDRRVEIASLSFDAPSLNLVRNLQGKWNFESLLRNSPAVHLRGESDAAKRPPFPYVEATDARINFKLGPEKLPFSLEGADLAIWKQSSGEWRARVQAHPVRTDLTVADAGQIRGEGILKAGGVLQDSPIHADLEWRRVQLGEIGRLLHGEDDGWRGTVDWTARVRGTLGKVLLTTNVGVEEFRRAEFVPPTEMDLSAACRAQYIYGEKTLDSLQCKLPLGNGRLLLRGRRSGISDIQAQGKSKSAAANPSSHRSDAASIHIALQHAPAGFFLDLLRHIHPGVAEDATASGELNGDIDCAWRGLDTLRRCGGRVQSAVLTLSLPHVARPLRLSPFLLESSPSPTRRGTSSSAPRSLPVSHNDDHSQASRSAGWSLAPAQVWLGEADPATITGVLNVTGSQVNITGPANLADLAGLAQVLKIPGMSGEVRSIHGSAQLALLLESKWLPQPASVATTAQIGQFAPSHWSGSVRIHNATLKLASLPGTVQLTSAQVNFTPAAVEWSNLHGSFAHSAFDGSLRWNTPCPTSKTACGRTFTLHTAELNTTRLQAALSGNVGPSDLLNAINPWANGPRKMPEMVGTLKADVVTADRISLKKVAMTLRLDGQRAELISLHGQAFGGTFSGVETEERRKDATPASLQAASEGEKSVGFMQWGKEAPQYSLGVVTLGIAPNRVAAIWHQRLGLGSDGSANARIALKTQGWSGDELARNAKGKFDITWRNGSFAAPFATLSPASVTITKFRRWSAEGTILNRTLALNRSQIVLDNSDSQMRTPLQAKQTVMGTVTFSGNLDLRLQPSSISIRGSLAMPVVTPATTPEPVNAPAVPASDAVKVGQTSGESAQPH